MAFVPSNRAANHGLNWQPPTRFAQGMTNTFPDDPMYMFQQPDPSWAHTYFNDFDQYVSGDWTVTVVGSGSNALAAGDGGWLVSTNSAANNDATWTQSKVASFAIVAGQQAWFKARFKISDATKSAFVMGFQDVTTTPLTIANGMLFSKALATTAVLANVALSSAATTSGTIATMDTGFHQAAIYYDGRSGVQFWWDCNRVYTAATTNLPVGTALVPSFGIKNGEGVAKTMTVDYILASTQRSYTTP